MIIAAPYDLDARLGVKRNHGWIGYKVHLTETCDDEEPHLIVPSETTAATTPDWDMAEPIHDASLTFRPQARYLALQAARVRQQTDAFKEARDSCWGRKHHLAGRARQ